ncbi:DUF4368 domain-containing protein [Microbacteriaceae bacterium 4G12]
MEGSTQSKNDKLAFTELKNRLEAFMNFKELTPEILHRLIERIEIKADGFENLLSILEPICLFFNPLYQRTAFYVCRVYVATQGMLVGFLHS